MIKRSARTVLTVMSVTLAGLTSACAVPSGPRYADVAARIAPPAAGQSRIWIYRSTTPIAMAIQPAVLVDGQPAGQAMAGSTFFADVPPGPHQLTLIDRSGTPAAAPVTVQTTPGLPAYIRVSAGIGFAQGQFRITPVSPEEAQDGMWANTFTGPHP